MNRYWILVVLILIKMVLQYMVVNPVYELHRDEFLYLDQADHLAFGYISVPPFMALISKIVQLFGGGLFWVRFFPALFGAVTIVYIWMTIETLGGSIFSRILGTLALIFSALMRLNILFQPNSFDILAWTMTFFFLIKFIQSDKSKWLYYLSVIIAIGFYNKYNMIFLIAGLAIGFILTFQRKLFTRPDFWKALILSLILLLPNITWQIANHFPVFQHMKVLKANQLDNISVAGFLKGQLMFFFGSLPITIAALTAFISFRPFRQYRFVGIAFVAVIIIFAMLKAKDYYAVGIYPIIFAFGCVYFDSILSVKWKRLIFPLLIFFNLALSYMVWNVLFPVYTPAQIREHAASFEKFGMLRWEDGKNHNLPQDFADMIGWKEMADKSLAAYKMLPTEELSNTLIICNNYGQAGALNYYNRRKMPQAYAFNTDYIYWLPVLNKIDNIVLIGKKPAQNILDMFKECKLTGEVTNEQAREKGTGIYLLTGANTTFTEAFYKLVEDRKRRLDIF